MDELNIDYIEQLELTVATKRKRKKKDKPKNEVPSTQRAWKVGYQAAQANLPETRNPFHNTASEEHHSWLEGWWSGFYDEPLHIGLATVANNNEVINASNISDISNTSNACIVGNTAACI